MNFVKSLAKQLASKGIRVNGVAPGPVWTPLQVSGGAPERNAKNLVSPLCSDAQASLRNSLRYTSSLRQMTQVSPLETSTVQAAAKDSLRLLQLTKSALEPLGATLEAQGPPGDVWL